MMIFFIALQTTLLFFMLFHDWIPVPPLNNVRVLKVVDGNAVRMMGSIINGLCVAIPLYITLKYYGKTIPTQPYVTIVLFYFCLSVGTIFSWWVPYFFVSSEKHKALFQKYNDTHHFLPMRGDNIIPNTLHVILHVQVWLCFIISLYFLIYK